jgi:hypothetical protein
MSFTKAPMFWVAHSSVYISGQQVYEVTGGGFHAAIMALTYDPRKTLKTKGRWHGSKLTLYETPGDAGPGRGFFPINPLVGSLTETTPFR